MSKTPIFYVMGVSGCGKSTIGKLLSEAFDIPFFDGDDFHPAANVKKMAAGNPLDDADRKGWLERLNILGIEHQQTGVVIACSALKQSYRNILLKNSTETIFVYLEGTYDQISQRLALRKNHFMPPGLLRSQLDSLETPKNAITVSIMGNPNAIVASIKTQYKNKKP